METKMTIRVCGPRSRAPKGAFVVNTTSRAKDWARGLSPFLIGPVQLYKGLTARNVENAWQYSKVYPEHVDTDKYPTREWYKWAEDGWSLNRAVRYPMGKGAVPVYSYWEGRRLRYRGARRLIYCPLYAAVVEKTAAYKQLQATCQQHEEVWLWCFDGYDYTAEGKTLHDVLYDESRSMGHSFVLAMLLDNNRAWEKRFSK